MNMRDKNGETASERCARKFLNGTLYGQRDCNTEMLVADGGRVYMTLYGTKIAYRVDNKVYLLSNFSNSGTMLTKSRQRALERAALNAGLTVEEV